MPKVNPAAEEAKRRRGDEFHRRLAALIEAKTREGLAADVSDGKIAKASGVERSTLTRIRNGDRLATTDQILAISKALGAPELVPADVAGGAMIPQAIESSGASVPRSKMPPGLEAFLERHGKRLKITRRERSYLERDRTETEAWLVKDDGHWERRLRFWRDELAIQDKASGIEGPEDPE